MSEITRGGSIGIFLFAPYYLFRYFYFLPQLFLSIRIERSQIFIYGVDGEGRCSKPDNSRCAGNRCSSMGGHFFWPLSFRWGHLWGVRTFVWGPICNYQYLLCVFYGMGAP